MEHGIHALFRSQLQDEVQTASARGDRTSKSIGISWNIMEYHENRWFYTYRLMYIVYHIYRYIMEIFYNGISFMGDSGTLWQYRSHFPMKWPMPGSSAAAAEELQGCDLGQFTQERLS